MRTRPLGRTGLHVSEIGFGTWGLGGNTRGAIAYGPADDRESLRALQLALDRGVTFYDTSDFYGYGHSEELLGQAFAAQRERVVIATKAGMVNAQAEQNFSGDYLRGALQHSLKRMRTDYIDLLLLHNPSLQQLEDNPHLIALLQALQREGLIRAWGISVRSPEDALKVIREYHAPVIEVNFNLVDQRARENGLFDICATEGVGCIVRTPLSFGFLTGEYQATASFDATDHRRRWSEQQRERWIEAIGLFTSAVQARQLQSKAQIALRFCLSYPMVSTAIPGMLTTAHVLDNVASSELGPLTLEEQRTIEAIYKQSNFFVEAKRASRHGAASETAK